MPLLKRKRVLAAKVETTIGTAESLTATEGAFNAYSVMIQPTIEVEEREAQASFNRLCGISGARIGTATFRTDLGWDGTTTMPTWATILLTGCGIVESSQVFTPRSEAPGTNVKTLTIGSFQDGKLRSIAGAMGTGRLVMPSGRMAYIDWTFTGVWQVPTDTAIIAPTYPVAKPIKFNSATVEFDSVGLQVESMTVDFGNNVIMREDPSTAAGYISALVTDRYPKITANPEAVLAATQDRHTQWLNSSEAALTATLSGPTDSKIVISAPKAQILNNQESDRSMMQVDDIEFGCNKNSTTNDQELSITFTEAS